MNNEAWQSGQPLDAANGWGVADADAERSVETGDVPYVDGHPQRPSYPVQGAGPTVHGYGVMAVRGAPYAPPPGLIDPVTGEHLSHKSKVLAGLLQCTVGWFGVGRFYLGDRVRGVAQLAMFFLGAFIAGFGVDLPIMWALSAWCVADAIYIWSGHARDQYGRRLR